nr:unnamed protein product [Digitaria exilis]
MREILKANLPTFTSEEKKLLQYKSDFIGLNHYTAIYVKDCIHSPCSLNTYEGNALVFATGERDGVKIGRDWSNVSREELINDVERLNYLQGYITYLSKAVRNGANVRGYFAWTLLDNFEWTFGYSVRYGLYHVDFDTQERTPRMSARWYRSFLTGSDLTDNVQEPRADS